MAMDCDKQALRSQPLSLCSTEQTLRLDALPGNGLQDCRCQTIFLGYDYSLMDVASRA